MYKRQFSYDDNASDISLPNVLRQCIQLIALFPVLSVYAYQAYNHYERGESLFIHLPAPELSTAENILHLLRPDSKYTKLEAKLLDMALVLHAEHGGGNNSTFTTHVVSSSGTEMCIRDSIVIGCDGAAIRNIRTGETLYENYLSSETCHKAFKICEKYGLQYYVLSLIHI